MSGGLRQQIGWQSVTPVVLAVAVALVGVAIWFYLARPTPLPAAEAKALVSDHTATGVWRSDRPYLLYFAPDGTALYGGVGQETQTGQWRVATGGEVCVRFSEGEESCYGLGRESGALVWILPGSGRTYPFVLLPGRDPAL